MAWAPTASGQVPEGISQEQVCQKAHTDAIRLIMLISEMPKHNLFQIQLVEKITREAE
jgi:hypothetical protein